MKHNFPHAPAHSSRSHILLSVSVTTSQLAWLEKGSRGAIPKEMVLCGRSQLVPGLDVQAGLSEDSFADLDVDKDLLLQAAYSKDRMHQSSHHLELLVEVGPVPSSEGMSGAWL